MSRKIEFLSSVLIIIKTLFTSNWFVYCIDAFESDSFFNFDDQLGTTDPPAGTNVETTLPSSNTRPPLQAIVEPNFIQSQPDLPRQPEPSTVCTPLQVLCQRIQETLDAISYEIRQFQVKAMQEIVESERNQTAQGCGLVQLMHTIEKLQRQQNAATNQTAPVVVDDTKVKETGNVGLGGVV